NAARIQRTATSAATPTRGAKIPQAWQAAIPRSNCRKRATDNAKRDGEAVSTLWLYEKSPPCGNRKSRSRSVPAMMPPSAVATGRRIGLRGAMPPNRLSSWQAVPLQMGSALPLFNVVAAALRLLITVLLLAAAPAIAASAPPDVLAARVTTTPERARLIVDLSGPTKFAVLSLASPDRIAIDIEAGAMKFDTAPPPAGTGLVPSFSVGVAAAGRVRATLALAQPAQVQQAYVLDAFGDQPARLVVDLIPDTADNFAKRAAVDAGAAGGTPA